MLPNAVSARPRISDFQRVGWWLSSAILRPSEILGLRKAALNRMSRASDFSASYPSYSSIANGKVDATAFGNIALSHQSVASILRGSAVGQLAGDLMGTSQVRLFSSSLIVKYPSSRQSGNWISWHTDAANQSTCSSLKMLTAWIPLHSVSSIAGGLQVLKNADFSILGQTRLLESREFFW